MRYVELCYTLPSDAAELAASTLVECGASGIEERDGTTLQRAAPGETVLVSWIEEQDCDAFVERAASALAGMGVPAERQRPQRTARDEEEWRDAWKRYFHARPVGRFVLVPSWETYVAKPGELVLDLDPGRAFGTGGHASTRLCLQAIDTLHAHGDLQPQRVFDVGCGSGVLSIAAARRWPTLRGEGVDIDPDAIEVSRENAERNRVHDRLRYSATPAAGLEGQAELVLANIQPEILIPMSATLCEKLAPGGALVLAGIIDEAADAVIAAYAALGAPTLLREEGWTALVYVGTNTSNDDDGHRGTSDSRGKRVEGGGSLGFAERGRPPLQ
jgi:ribosomal protein L11 methyltransferase